MSGTERATTGTSGSNVSLGTSGRQVVVVSPGTVSPESREDPFDDKPKQQRVVNNVTVFGWTKKIIWDFE